MTVNSQQIEAELEAMKARRTEFQQSLWQADGACQVLEQLLALSKAEAPVSEPQTT